MKLDQKVGEERKQFATQVASISETEFEQIKTMFDGGQTVEFYEGLLAGYACSYQIINSSMENLLGPIIAYISEIIEERS